MEIAADRTFTEGLTKVLRSGLLAEMGEHKRDETVCRAAAKMSAHGFQTMMKGTPEAVGRASEAQARPAHGVR